MRKRYKSNFNKLSQLDRRLPEIDVNYVYPNERSSDQLLNYTFKYSKFLNYYNNQNNIDGNWQEFYSANFEVLLSILKQIDFYEYKEKFQLVQENIYNSYDIFSINISLNKLFDFLFDLLDDIEDIYKLILSIDMFTFDKKLAPLVLDEIIFFRQQLTNWIEEVNSIDQVQIFSNHIGNINQNVILPRDFQIFQNGPVAIDRIKNGLEALNLFFVEIVEKSRHQILIIKKALETRISLNHEESNYPPNLGLIKTFIDLSLLLNKQNNLITKKHLDFYFKDILLQSPNNAKQDYVHVVVIPGINNESFLLKKGTLFNANLENSIEELLYKSVTDVVIYQSKVKRLVNLNFSQTSQNEISEKILYTKDIVIENPIDGIETNVTSLFGHNQTFIPVDSFLKMDLGVFGFLVGSKILFQESGEIIVNILFYLDEYSFESLSNFISRYSNDNRRDQKVLANDLFKAAFEIYYTTIDGWFEIENFTVSFDTENNSDRKIEYNFKLHSTDPNFSLYSNPLHGNIENIETPMFKFIINPYSFYNAYNYLNTLNFNRIGFQVIVKECVDISLRNSSGNLSIDSPVTAFGSNPSPHSFLDIQSENIFNKYTKNFSVNIYWHDLPTNEEGFKDYYKEYNADIQNDSYEIGISSFDNGNFKPIIKDQQSIKLFESYRIDDKLDFLNTKTNINSIDFTKLVFTNDMNLNRLESDIITRHSKGILRLTLLEPYFSFGHKTFPKLFSEVSLNNVKRFKKKKKIPNEPISPSIKSVSVNFTLESSELFIHSLSKSKKKKDISLIHLHPQGFEKMYPEQKKELFSLIPTYASDNQLVIGIDNIYLDQELSMYFELEEIKFDQSRFEDYQIKWSYLSSNNWKLFSNKYIKEDSTKNLLQSGIIKLQIPNDINNNNSIFNDNLYYLKVELFTNQNFKKALKNIFINGVLVEKVIDINVANEFQFLPERAIDKTAINIPEIDQILQPYSNFNGSFSETEDNFYTRISEMLRTKNRFVSSRDICQAILNKFPDISYVECMSNGAQKNTINENEDIIITVLPKFRKIEDYNSEDLPCVDTDSLHEISEYIKNFIPKKVNIKISNPIFEKIKVNCKVIFQDNRSTQIIKVNSNKLNQDISEFIAPWIVKGSEYGFETLNSINIDDLVNFIQKRPYVKMVNSLSIIHIYQEFNKSLGGMKFILFDSAKSSLKIIATSSQNSIFSPVNLHQIIPITQASSKSIKSLGINDLEIGKELIIQDEISYNNELNVKASDNQKNTIFSLILKM
jgi:hypothetical protein